MARAQGVAPPREAVLPVWAYALLAAEVAGLFALHHFRPEESGGEHFSYLLGWAGLWSMVVMHVYSLRKRVRALSRLGHLRSWLRFHIFLGLQGAILVTYHSLHLHDAATIQGANILCVGIVVASGIFGRYLYSQLPKSIHGDRLSARQIEDELAELAQAVRAQSPPPELAAAVDQCAQANVSAGQALRDLERALRGPSSDELREFARIARRRVMLTRRLATLSSAEKVFRYWSILHKPLTFLLLAATLLHVLAHYVYASGMSG